jgi:hypothetical protein
MKTEQKYAAKRDNLLGSSAWARLAETVVNLQFPDGKDTKGKRLMAVLLRNAPAEEFTLGFEDGQLVQVPNIDEDEAEQGVSAAGELRWFEQQINWWTILDVARAFSMGESTAYRHVNDAWTKDILVKKTGPKTGKGHATMFKWNWESNNPILLARKGTKDEAKVEQETSVL